MPHQTSMNLLFSFNRSYLGLFLSCLKSILRSGGYDHYDVYVLHNCFDEAMISALGRDFGDRVTFHFIALGDDLFEDFPETSRYPKEIYYRLAAPLLLPKELERILYLDVDTIVINPLRELYETPFEGNYYAGCTHIRDFLTKFNQARLKSDKAETYLNTGVLLLNLPALRENLSMADICGYVRRQGRSFILPDQDILAALYGDRVKTLDTLRYNLSDRILRLHNAKPKRETLDLQWVRENAVIIHYCGKQKPWRDDYTGTLGVFYNELMSGAS